jgi:hypothetical protein
MGEASGTYGGKINAHSMMMGKPEGMNRFG